MKISWDLFSSPFNGKYVKFFQQVVANVSPCAFALEFICSTLIASVLTHDFKSIVLHTIEVSFGNPFNIFLDLFFANGTIDFVLFSTKVWSNALFWIFPTEQLIKSNSYWIFHLQWTMSYGFERHKMFGSWCWGNLIQ